MHRLVCCLSGSLEDKNDERNVDNEGMAREAMV